MLCQIILYYIPKKTTTVITRKANSRNHYDGLDFTTNNILVMGHFHIHLHSILRVIQFCFFFHGSNSVERIPDFILGIILFCK